MSDLLDLLYDEALWASADWTTKTSVGQQIEALLPAYFQFSGIQTYVCNGISNDIATFQFIPFLTTEIQSYPPAANFSLIPGRTPMFVAQTTVTWSAWTAILPFEKSLGMPLSEFLAQFSALDSTVARFLEGFREVVLEPADSWEALLKRYEEARGEGSSDEISSFGLPGSLLEPARYLSLFDALRFLEALPVPMRLPSNEEWQFLARAGSSGAWCFGDDPSQRSDYGNCLQPSEELFKMSSIDHLLAAAKPQVVASLKPNAFGLFDVHGNVLELVTSQDPMPRFNCYFVVFGKQGAAGGCAWTTLDHCQLDNYAFIEPFLRDRSTGIRLVAGLTDLIPGMRSVSGEASPQ